MSRAILFALTAALIGCNDVRPFPADVTLSIDGVQHDYSTTVVEWECQGVDGPISVYLLPEDTYSGQPYVNLRYYSGNPVGHFWVRYVKTDEAGEPLEGEYDSDPGKYECFVPGKLRDGTETLTWMDGESERHRADTGETGCTVTVTETAETLKLDFDTDLLRKKKKSKGGHGGGGDDGDAKGHEERIRVVGSGVIRLK